MASLTVIELDVRADVSRADMVLPHTLADSA